MNARSTASVQQTKQNETDIAVLQVQYQNLNEKVDDLKTGLKELAEGMKEQNKATQTLITGFQDDNVLAHKEMASKISQIEKWKWMLMGAGVLLGTFIIPIVDKFIKLQH